MEKEKRDRIRIENELSKWEKNVFCVSRKRIVGGVGGGSINKQLNEAREWIEQIHINER